jgi:hypothetical protein
MFDTYLNAEIHKDIYFMSRKQVDEALSSLEGVLIPAMKEDGTMCTILVQHGPLNKTNVNPQWKQADYIACCHADKSAAFVKKKHLYPTSKGTVVVDQGRGGDLADERGVYDKCDRTLFRGKIKPGYMYSLGWVAFDCVV